MRPPTSRSICGDVSGNRLSARRAETRKRRHPHVAEVVEDGLPRCRRRRAARAPRSKSWRCRTRGAAAPPPAPTRSGEPSTISMRPIFVHDTRHVEVAVAVRMFRTSRAMNHGPVAPLQRDLLIVNDNRIHENRLGRQAAADGGAFDRSGQTRINPVPCEHQSRDVRSASAGASAGPAPGKMSRAARARRTREGPWLLAPRARPRAARAVQAR